MCKYLCFIPVKQMDAIVKEFEQEYAHGQRLDEVRKFVNKYFIKGGEHAREKRENDTKQRIMEKKLQLLEYLLQTP